MTSTEIMHKQAEITDSANRMAGLVVAIGIAFGTFGATLIWMLIK